MSSAQVQRPLKVDNSEEKAVSKNKSRSKENEKFQKKTNSNSAGHFPKKYKHENDGRNFKFSRKRSQSFTAGGGKFFPPYKRRKKEGTIIPPTKFLLGGNIYDPLNLNSLQDEEVNRAMNAVTPKSSPLPTPRHRKGEIEVIIPPNLNDPLNLISCEDDAEYEQQLVSPTKRGRKSRKKKKRNSSSGGSTKDDSSETVVPVASAEGVKALDDEKEPAANVTACDSETPVVVEQENPAKKDLSLDLGIKDKDLKPRKSTEDSGVSGSVKEKTEKKRKCELKDKIVSPVIPQPGAWKRPPQYGHRGGGNMGAADGRFNRYRPGQNKKGQQPQPMPNFKKKDAYFQYGNYLRYYGYRNPQHDIDVRLKYFAERKELFQDKDVLDIGCNIGHVTLIIARDFGARSVVGLDIDRKLIGIARKNVRHYINCAASPPTGEPARAGQDSRFFPISMPILYGPVDIPGISHGQSPSASKKFPHNVTFIQGNYVLDSDALLVTEQPQFDMILCLSVTKWLHLNWGDAGLKQAFKRMYLQLRPGGRLILEAQAWESYKRKKNLTETIYKNYHSIEFFPQKFTEYLLSSEVGFTKCEVIGTPFHQSKGFQRPVQLFTKGEISPARSAASNTNTPSHTVVSGASRPPVYMAVSFSSREADDDEASEKTTEEQHELTMETDANPEDSSQASTTNELSSKCRETDDEETSQKTVMEASEQDITMETDARPATFSEDSSQDNVTADVKIKCDSSKDTAILVSGEGCGTTTVETSISNVESCDVLLGEGVQTVSGSESSKVEVEERVSQNSRSVEKTCEDK